MIEIPKAKRECEYLRARAGQRWEPCRSTWIDTTKWAAPHRATWLLSQVPGERNNHHIVDPTHGLALRSYVAGFMEGNTSATRPWYRSGTNDTDFNRFQGHKKWLDGFTRRQHQILSTSNFYHAGATIYLDIGTIMTSIVYIDETPRGPFFHVLTPGEGKLINNGYGEAVVLVREFQLTVKAVVDTYARKDKDGKRDWSNISKHVRKMYDSSEYLQMIDIVHVIKENDQFDPNLPQIGLNRQWISYTYERGGYASYAAGGEPVESDFDDREKFLSIKASRRKPFIAPRSESSSNFEYGQKGPTLDALGLIKSLNKKAISKDQAVEQMLRPALQGPANLRKSYVTTAPNSYVPIDAAQLGVTKGRGLQPVFEVNPAIGVLLQDVTDLRQMVDKIYYADYLLYLSRNPKTRTATETNAILQEQQLIIGPILQSLNWTFNVPVVDWLMDFVLWDDPWIQENPVPEELTGKFLRPEFISVFAQAQKAADLPAVERFIGFAEQVGQLNPQIWDKVNLDRVADVYEDRLFLPAGVNRPQSEVDAKREQAQAQAQRQQILAEALPAMAGAARDMSSASNQ